MRHLKRFNESNKPTITESQVEDYLKLNYTQEWFDFELAERVYDYISDEEAADFDDDREEAYKNLSSGGAIEYDLLNEMSQETALHFDIPVNQVIEVRSILDISQDHLMDTCTWYDTFTFNSRSTEPYKSNFGSYDDIRDIMNGLE